MHATGIPAVSSSRRSKLNAFSISRSIRYSISKLFYGIVRPDKLWHLVWLNYWKLCSQPKRRIFENTIPLMNASLELMYSFHAEINYHKCTNRANLEVVRPNSNHAINMMSVFLCCWLPLCGLLLSKQTKQIRSSRIFTVGHETCGSLYSNLVNNLIIITTFWQ